MTTLEIIKPAEPLTDSAIATMSNEEFGNHLRDLFSQAARAIMEVVRVIRARAAAGHALPSLPGVWRTCIPRILSGAMLPETAVALFRSPEAVVKAVSLLPVAEQRRLVIDGEPLEVCERTANGETATRLIPVQSLMTTHAKLVFGDGYIREPGEQIARLTAPHPTAKGSKPCSVGIIKLDRKTQTVRIGKSKEFVTADEMMRALRAMGWDTLGL